MCTKHARRTVLGDLTVNGSVYSIRLGLGGNYTVKLLARHKRGNGKSKSVSRNVIDLCEATVVNLLIAADLIKLYGLNKNLIVEICNRRIGSVGSNSNDPSVLTPNP